VPCYCPAEAWAEAGGQAHVERTCLERTYLALLADLAGERREEGPSRRAGKRGAGAAAQDWLIRTATRGAGS
jgi:hypothetical protein